jgi:DNA (cytosine-5)-methyltransferase 1
MKVAGLFAGIGGFETGFASAGLHASLLCDVLPAARAVLEARFPDVEYRDDVRTLRSLPSEVEVLCGGFPCQDLSQAGRTAGLEGSQSGLIEEVFRLLSRRRVPTVVIENVPFMLQLNGGSAIRAIVEEFERRSYRWAYRVVDTFSFGLPQRRERVFLVASRALDPSAVLLADDRPLLRPATAVGQVAHGFYWTEGLSGLGWAVDAVPTLKNGSTIGIPSPPAVLMPDGRIVKPTIEDAERLQGFEAGWTQPAVTTGKASARWGLVGSAISVPVARWLGGRLREPGRYDEGRDLPFPQTGKAPRAARYDGRRRSAVTIGTDPVGVRPPPLAEFLSPTVEPLSLKAAAGFLSRTRRAKLRFDPAFIRAVERHVFDLGGTLPLYPVDPEWRVAA